MDLNKQILSRRPIIIALIAILVVLIGGGGFWVYRLAWAPNFKLDKTVYVYIDDKKDFDVTELGIFTPNLVPVQEFR